MNQVVSISGRYEGRAPKPLEILAVPNPSRLTILDDAWKRRSAGDRFDAVRAAARELREHLRAGAAVTSVRTLKLSRFPYPTKYAFGGAARHPAPYVELEHRALLVQFAPASSAGPAKRPLNLLFNPTDVEGAKATPFFAQLLEQIPRALHGLLLPKPYAPLEAQLAGLGVGREAIDYVAFDHFHTQDLRRVFDRFPNARLIAPRSEWDAWANLHPMQRPWYVAGGRDGVEESRVVFVDGDIQLGEGVILARTPGHTVGNQTLFVKTQSGIWGCAENGTCADAWSPAASRIGGLRAHAKEYRLASIVNANTLECGGDQLTSMALESIVVDRASGDGDFVQMFPSSELVPSWMAPGIRATHVFGAITDGDIVRC